MTSLVLVASFLLAVPASGEVVPTAGSIVGWGHDYYGQATPPAGSDYTAIAAGGHHSLALKTDGSIVGWGRNEDGQATPPAGNDYTAIAAGGYHSLALRTDGSIVGWGNDYHGQATPPAGNDYTAVAAGWSHGVALKADGSIVCWGSNEYGKATPPAGNDYTAIAAAYDHNLALRSDGSILAWGISGYGFGTPPAGNDYIAIAPGQDHALALKADGSIVGWARNLFGEATPPAGSDYTAIDAGGYYSLALKADGSIVGWGYDSSGQATPPTGDHYTAISAGGSHGLALATTPPETMIDSDPGVLTNDRTPTFTFSSDRPGSSFECKIDGGAWDPCSGPGSSHTTFALADGPHRFQVRAFVGDDVDATPAVFDFTVDTTPPDTQIDSHPGAETDDPTPTFAFSASESPATFECRVDADAWGACSGPGDTHTPAALDDGAHTFRVRATDEAGNMDASPAEHAFTVETNEAPSLDPLAPQSVVEGDPLAFTATATDPDPGDTLTYSSADLPAGAALDPDTGEFAWTPGLGEAGSHTVHLVVTDLGGLTDGADVEITVTEADGQPIRLRARPAKVRRGERVRLIARTPPCGEGPDPLILYRGRQRIGKKRASEGEPVVFRIRMLRTVRFRIVMPDMALHGHYGGVSIWVRVRVVR